MSTSDAPATDAAWDHTECPGTVGCPPRCPRFLDRAGAALTIRPVEAAAGDYAALRSFYEDYPHRHRSMSLPPLATAQLDAWLERLLERGRNIVAYDGDRLVGHVAYSPRDGTESELVVFVDEDYHDRGIGTELCRQAVAYAAADGHEAMVLHVGLHNDRAQHVYGHLGFRSVERNDDNVKMRLEIDAALAADLQAPPAERC